jgi:hypothetical protein
MLKMPTYAEWIRSTDAGLLTRRGADLDLVDRCLVEYDKSRNRASLEALDLAFKNWKRKNPMWNMSARNRSGALTRLSAALLERMDGMLNQQDFIWCPGIDAEMRKCGEKMIDDLGLDRTLYEGGTTGLEKFSSNAKCYILAHGHSEMPVFSTKKGKWTADQLASMLLASGLNPEIRNIEMLVCHAGESVNSIANGNALYDLMRKHQAAKAANRAAEMTRIEAEYSEVTKSDTRLKPLLYIDPVNQLLPMAAGLANSLKKLGFSHFRLTSYKAPVQQDCGEKQYKNVVSPAGVRLDLESKVSIDTRLQALTRESDYIAVMYALAKDWPDYVAVWH